MVTVAAMAPLAGVVEAAVALPRPWSMPMAVFNVVHISSLFTIQAGALIAGAPFWAIQQPVEIVVERAAL